MQAPHGPNHRGALPCLGASATALAALPLLLLSDGGILGNAPSEKVSSDFSLRKHFLRKTVRVLLLKKCAQSF